MRPSMARGTNKETHMADMASVHQVQQETNICDRFTFIMPWKCVFFFVKYINWKKNGRMKTSHTCGFVWQTQSGCVPKNWNICFYTKTKCNLLSYSLLKNQFDVNRTLLPLYIFCTSWDRHNCPSRFWWSIYICFEFSQFNSRILK
jgi:hypothetical protein